MSTVSSAAAPAVPPGRSLLLSRVSDELLARQAARGSERAFASLYERYHQQLYRYCRSIVRNDADAQDVLQSTFTAALSALRRDRRNAPLRPWLYRIAHNEAITLLRRRSRESSHELPESGPQAISSAEDQAADRARWSTLVSDLAGLPERQRSALLLRELSGLSHDEIAIALGTGVGGAKQAIFEARQALAELAEGRAMSCDEVRRRVSAGDRRVLRGRRVRAHLGDCPGCKAFVAEIPARRAELRAFAPVLPASAAAAVLSRTLHAASAHGGSAAAAGSAAATAGAVGKAAGTAVIWKAATGVAVLATAAAGVTGLEHVLRHRHAPVRPATRTGERRGAAARATGAVGSARVIQHDATASGAARDSLTRTSAGAIRRRHAASIAGGAAVAGGAATAAGRAAQSHGSGAAAVGKHNGGAGHSHPSARTHGPGTHGHAKSGSGRSGSRANTNSNTKSQASQGPSGAQVTATAHGKPHAPRGAGP